MTFVATNTLQGEELRELLEKLAASGRYYYFLRWPHNIQGFVEELPETLSPEGQIVTANCELRWKQHGTGNDVLLLSTEKHVPEGFTAIDAVWSTQDHAAVVAKDDSRFPWKFQHKTTKIGQRYFLDSRTNTVHFVALALD